MRPGLLFVRSVTVSLMSTSVCDGLTAGVTVGLCDGSCDGWVGGVTGRVTAASQSSCRPRSHNGLTGLGPSAGAGGGSGSRDGRRLRLTVHQTYGGDRALEPIARMSRNP